MAPITIQFRPDKLMTNVPIRLFTAGTVWVANRRAPRENATARARHCAVSIEDNRIGCSSYSKARTNAILGAFGRRASSHKARERR